MSTGWGDGMNHTALLRAEERPTETGIERHWREEAERERAAMIERGRMELNPELRSISTDAYRKEANSWIDQRIAAMDGNGGSTLPQKAPEALQAIATVLNRSKVARNAKAGQSRRGANRKLGKP